MNCHVFMAMSFLPAALFVSAKDAFTGWPVIWNVPDMEIVLKRNVLVSMAGKENSAR